MQQGHFIGFLLDALGRVALSRDVEQHHPDSAGVELKMQIGGAASCEFDRRHEIGCLKKRQQPFEEVCLLNGRLAEAHRRQPVILEMAARADEGQLGIALQIGHRPLAIRQRLQPLSDVRGQALHGSLRDADRQVQECVLHAFAR